MPNYGWLAQTYCDVRLPLEVLQSAAGYYIGTQEGRIPCSRESDEYWPTYDEAAAALRSGRWTQKTTP